jgi:glycosyltransferase involved in cell wall biosynthesis
MASSARTFAAARAAGKATVLNFVNSHPAAQNHYLHELAGLTAGHHEMVPPEVARDVDRELALADLVLVPSRFVLEQLRSRGLEERRLAVEPYGIDPGPYTSVQRKKRPGEDVACVMVGQIGFRKGVRILLDAARLLEGRGVRFRLVGPMVSPSAYRDPPPNVDWAGARAPAGVPAELGLADIFVLPSLEDSYGLVVLEAMAAGLPVVTTTHTGASELLTHGVEGLVVPAGDVGALVDAVQWLARDPVRRQAMGEAARRRVLATSGATSYTDRVLGRVRALLEDRAS